ncbi:MAG: N-acetyl-gamma-glutamyl-phosphate reductase, partial [Glaciecola sp.]
MIKTCIIGASGYTGAELVNILAHHEGFALETLYVSEHSTDAGLPINECHASLIGVCDLPLVPINDAILAQMAWDCDAIFLATPHEASHDWMPV